MPGKKTNGVLLVFSQRIFFNPQRPAMSTIYVQKEGQKLGPFTTEELEGKVGEGLFSPEDLFWTEGMEEWHPLGEVLTDEQPADEEFTSEELQEAEEAPVFEIDENNILFDSPEARLTAQMLHLGGEDIPVTAVAKATVQTETIHRTKPIIGSVVLGVAIICGALIEVQRTTLTHWLIWGAILAGLVVWWLRLFSAAIRPASSMLIVDLRNGDERLLPMEPADARELAAAIDQAVITAMDR
jgi:hypothetical protein